MNEQQALAKMIPPGQKRPGKPGGGGVIQIHLTRACNLQCFNCTQGSNLAGKNTFITPTQFEEAVLSLKGYFGVVGVFGGNPAIHPQFGKLCEIIERHVPFPQRGLWCNHPLGKGKLMRGVFNPAVSNLNVHLDQGAYNEFKRDWPESNPFGLTQDSRHSPCYVAMKDVLRKPCNECVMGWLPGEPAVRCEACDNTGRIYDEEQAWSLISDCDINKHWSAMIAVFRGELRAYFCEIAGAQAILHQDDPDYPDTGVELWLSASTPNIHGESKLVGGLTPELPWWRFDMGVFRDQVRKHCHECSVPLRGYGELAQSNDGVEQVSATHQGIYRTKRKDRKIELVTLRSQLQEGRITKTTDYVGNSKK